MKKRIVETEVLREKPQSIANKSRKKKNHEKERTLKNERKNIKHNINIISILRHSIAISQLFTIDCFISFTAAKRQENAQNQQNK